MSDLPDTPEPQTTPAVPAVADDHGAALERSAQAIHEAKDASGSVAAHEDITSLDDRRAGQQGQDAEGDGGTS